jgi:peroxiredoxin
MKRKDLITAVAAVAIVAGAALVWLNPWGGKPAPDVVMRDLSGDSIRLSDFQGQPVLLQFWATTCVTCVAEMPHLVELHRELAPEGLAMIGVAMSYDPPEQVRRMVQEKQLPYRIALDDGDVAAAFGDVRLTPTTVLIDPQGRIDWRHMGFIDFQQLEARIRDMLAGA